MVEARRLAPLFPPRHRETVENLCNEISELAQKLESSQDEEVINSLAVLSLYNMSFGLRKL